MKKSIMQDPFSMMPFSFFIGALKIALIVSLIFRLYFDVSRYGFNALIVYCLVCVVSFLFLMLIFFIQSKELRKFSNSKVEKCECYGILISSCSPGRKHFFYLPNLLGLIFFREKATYQRFYFRDKNGNEDYFYDVVTSGKTEIFRSVFSAKVTFRGLGVWTKRIDSFGDIPLKITYDRNSHMLVSLSCVPDYSYSDEQRDLIEQLDARYLVTPYEYATIKGGHKSKLASKESFPASTIACLIFIISVMVSIGTIGGISFLYDVISLNMETIILFGGIAVLYFSVKIIRMPWSLFFDRTRKDDRAILIGETGILKALFPISNDAATYNDVHLLYSDDYVCCLKCFYLKNKSIIRYPDCGASDYFYISLTNRKLDLFHCLYKVVPTESFGFYCACFKFLNDIPLNLIMNKRSRILKSIAPAEGYEYTEEQLAAIEKFNTLYP